MGVRVAGFILPILALSPAARAGNLTYGADAGMEETDNVGLAHTDKLSQTIAVTDLDFDYLQRSKRLDVDAKGNFSYLDYLQHAYGSQLVGRFDGSATAALIPQRLTWSLQDSYGQATLNPYTPTTPTNLENINTVSTGPDLYLRLGGATFLDLSARVGHAQYAVSPFSNSRASGSLGWGVKLSPLSSVSINGDTERVWFENTLLNTDFQRSNAFFRYALTGARTDATADLGATVVTVLGQSTTGGLARFRLSRRISASARLIFSVGHDAIDGTTAFGALPQGAGGPGVITSPGVSTAPGVTGVGGVTAVPGVTGTAAAINTSDTYVSNYATAGWAYQRNRTTLALNARWEKDTYAGDTSLNRTLTTGELRLQRTLTPAFALQISGIIYESDYENADAIANSVNGSAKNQNVLIAAAVTWRHGRALEVKLAGEHSTYTTSPNNTGYLENRIYVTIGYRPFKGSSISQELPDIN